MPPILVAHDLKKQFETVFAVKGVSFEIQEGEIFSLLGPNGAGKTTTISMLSTLIAPTAGDASVGGHSITTAPMEVRQLIGIVPQDLALYEDLSARENLSFWGQMYGLRGKALKGELRLQGGIRNEPFGFLTVNLHKQRRNSPGIRVLYLINVVANAGVFRGSVELGDPFFHFFI